MSSWLPCPRAVRDHNGCVPNPRPSGAVTRPEIEARSGRQQIRSPISRAITGGFHSTGVSNAVEQHLQVAFRFQAVPALTVWPELKVESLIRKIDKAR